ncbi:LysR family transcriptional regulator [Pigmentiphaga soli]|uniref:LysR family transcriptional regulator n=1 Tax=Pigmentiphaga soli TaxID=1007095 RepID=A0ABP8GPS6_9BURK
MELRHLRYFVAVAEEGHVTRAAHRLGMRQPPLTQQIQILERELGVQLFDRSPRRIELNQAGRLFLDDARDILAAADAAIQKVRRFDPASQRTLRVGLTTSSAIHSRTRALLNRFRDDGHVASLHIEEGAAIDLLKALADEALDVAFIRADAPPTQALASQWLAEDDLVVALPADHPRAEQDYLNLHDLKMEKLVIYRQERCVGIAQMLLARCARSGFEPKVAAETRRLLSALNMAAAGGGLTVIPRSMEAFRLDGIVYRPLVASPSLTAPVNMVYRRSDTREDVRRFLDMGQRVSEAELVA